MPDKPRSAEQDGEYLHDAHSVIAEALASGGPVEDELDAATAVLDELARNGWYLFNAADAEKLLGAWTLQEIRGGRGTFVESVPDQIKGEIRSTREVPMVFEDPQYTTDEDGRLHGVCRKCGEPTPAADESLCRGCDNDGRYW